MDTTLLRKKILDLAIHGKLVPQDPNEEPASVLFERIMAEKKRLVKKGQIKKSIFNDKSTDSLDGLWEIPSGWIWCHLGDIFNHNTGKALNKADRDGVLMEYITTSNLYWNKFDLSSVKKMLFLEQEQERCKVIKGDLLVCEGGDIGRTAVWNYETTIMIQNHIHRLRGYCNLNHKFYYYIFLIYKMQNYIGGKGVAIQGLSSSELDKLIIPLPPIAEQKRIVAEIERWFTLIDKIEQGKIALQTFVKQAKSKILDLAIHGKLVPQDSNDEPAIELLKRINPKYKDCDNSNDEQTAIGWCTIHLGDICKLKDGEKQSGRARINLDAKFLRGIKDGNIIKSGKLVKKGDFLILVDGENSGEVFKSPIEGYQGSTFKILDIPSLISEDYILAVIASYKKTLRENKTGSAIPHLNKKLFNEIMVCLPPLTEQKRIVSKIEELYSELDKILAQL